MDLFVDLRNRYAMGDFTGSLAIAEVVLALHPDNPEARRFQTSCQDVLTQVCAEQLGDLALVPHLLVPITDIQWLEIDHRAGFILSCVDGRLSLEEILDVSGMPRMDALRILLALRDQGVIEVHK